MSRRRTQIRPFGDQAGYLLMILISIVASVLAHRGGQPAIAVAATADTGKQSTAPTQPNHPRVARFELLPEGNVGLAISPSKLSQHQPAAHICTRHNT